jgi:hypothetical protein
MSDGIDRFWSFWEANQASLLRAIEVGNLDSWTERISAAVVAIHPDLGSVKERVPLTTSASQAVETCPCG